jgi:hypothetical protein
MELEHFDGKKDASLAEFQTDLLQENRHGN